MPPKRRSVSDDAMAKKSRKSAFTTEEIMVLFNHYEEKLDIFRNEGNSALVRKKFNNLATQVKSLHAQYKGDLVATDGGCPPNELPSWAAFIIDQIMPQPFWKVSMDDSNMDVWGIVPIEMSLSMPIDTPINMSAPSQRSSAHKLSPKESLDAATIDALAMEKAKFEGEAEKLCAKN
uniref:Uncharacterized protein n=1 Tax=Plectus sambesii TaxID=2011161 RepID=A0A914UQR7_9BILA